MVPAARFSIVIAAVLLLVLAACEAPGSKGDSTATVELAHATPAASRAVPEPVLTERAVQTVMALPSVEELPKRSSPPTFTYEPRVTPTPAPIRMATGQPPATLLWQNQQKEYYWDQSTRPSTAYAPSVAVSHFVYALTKSRLCALDKQTGNEMWSFPYSSGSRSEIVLAGNMLLFTTSKGNANGTYKAYLNAVNSLSGRQEWSLETGETKAAPLFALGSVAYFWSYDEVEGGGPGGYLNRVDLPTGKLLWKHSIPQGQSFIAPAFEDGTVYFRDRKRSGVQGSYLYAVNTRTQQENWLPLPDEITGNLTSLLVANGTAVFTVRDLDDVYALDIKTGRKKWHVTTNLEHGSLVTATANMIYFSDARSNGYSPSIGIEGRDFMIFFGALEGTTGREKWRVQVGYASASTLVHEGTVYYSTARFGLAGAPLGIEASLHALDTLTGDEKWAFSTDGAVQGSMATADSVLYFADARGNFYAIQEASP